MQGLMLKQIVVLTFNCDIQGTDLMKHGRHGKPKVHYFRLAENDTHLTWRSAKGNQRGVSLSMVKQVSLLALVLFL